MARTTPARGAWRCGRYERDHDRPRQPGPTRPGTSCSRCACSGRGSLSVRSHYLVYQRSGHRHSDRVGVGDDYLRPPVPRNGPHHPPDSPFQTVGSPNPTGSRYRFCDPDRLGEPDRSRTTGHHRPHPLRRSRLRYASDRRPFDGGRDQLISLGNTVPISSTPTKAWNTLFLILGARNGPQGYGKCK